MRGIYTKKQQIQNENSNREEYSAFHDWYW